MQLHYTSLIIMWFTTFRFSCFRQDHRRSHEAVRPYQHCSDSIRWFHSAVCYVKGGSLCYFSMLVESVDTDDILKGLLWYKSESPMSKIWYSFIFQRRNFNHRWLRNFWNNQNVFCHSIVISTGDRTFFF